MQCVLMFVLQSTHQTTAVTTTALTPNIHPRRDTNDFPLLHSFLSRHKSFPTSQYTLSSSTCTLIITIRSTLPVNIIFSSYQACQHIHHESSRGIISHPPSGRRYDDHPVRAFGVYRQEPHRKGLPQPARRRPASCAVPEKGKANQ